MWAIGNETDLSVEVCKPKLNSWLNVTSLDTAVNEQMLRLACNKVLDAIIFDFNR